MMNDILAFSEFRIKQALWIQKELSKPWYVDNRLGNLLRMYCDYLNICGIPEQCTDDIKELKYNVDEQYRSYDEQIEKNINHVVDEILNSHLAIEKQSTKCKINRLFYCLFKLF